MLSSRRRVTSGQSKAASLVLAMEQDQGDEASGVAPSQFTS
jgi:hypothetical protein